jgi:FG-GAP repeat
VYFSAHHSRYGAHRFGTLGADMRKLLAAKSLAGFALCAAAVAIGSDGARSQSPAAAPTLRQIAYLKASNAGAGDHFGDGGALTGHTGLGLAISADGSTLAVGAPHESSGSKGVNGNQNDESAYGSGAVYVFTRRGDSWAQQAYIKASNAGQSARFGTVVALSADGNTLAVSAVWEASGATGINGDQNDESIPQAGAAYIFTRTGTAWMQQAYIKASNTGRASNGSEEDFGDGDQFGYSLALSGDGNTLAVGAISEDSQASGINNLAFQKDDSAASSGAVYVYARTGATWTQQSYVKGSNTSAGDLFGFNVGLSGDGNTMVVAGYDEDGSTRQVNGIPDNLRNGAGCLYVFVRANGVWTQQAYLKGSRSETADSLGYSLAISEDGNTIAGGAADETCYTPGINPPGCTEDRAPNNSVGAAYVFVRDGANWSEQAFIKASNPGLTDWFAVRMALSGDGNTLAVAAPNENGGSRGINGQQDDDSADDAGAVYLFTRSGNTWKQEFYVKASNTEAFDEFGESLALSRDGRLLAVGAPKEDSAAQGVNGNQNDNSANEAGAAYVFARD